MSKHTPGPWTVEIDDHGRGRIKKNGCWLATTWTKTDDNIETTYPAEANARLIAAAPDLYSACRAMIEVYSGDPDSPECRLMRDALAKAEGRATSE